MHPTVKKLLPIAAVVAIAVSLVVVLRTSRPEAAGQALTPAEEKLMRTPTGVLQMPPEAAEAMRRANQGPKSPTGR